jgi:ABC-2 type transport system ATP-binding protein
MISINELTFGYRRKKPLYEGLSFDLKAGKVYGLLGENGTGKSTLLYLLCGLLHPQRGSVTYAGANVKARTPEQLSSMFLIPEEVELPKTRLSHYLSVSAPFYPNFSHERMREYMASFGLDMEQNLGALSMGQKKKVIICIALASGARLLLMDEPTNGLDIPGKSIFRQLVSGSMNEDRTILISTHQAADIDRMLDEVLILEQGGLRLRASVSLICQRLQFVIQASGEEPSKHILYKQPNMGGHSLVLENTTGTESPFNLELLFNALRHDPQTVGRIVNQDMPSTHLNTPESHEEQPV